MQESNENNRGFLPALALTVLLVSIALYQNSRDSDEAIQTLVIADTDAYRSRAPDNHSLQIETDEQFDNKDNLLTHLDESAAPEHNITGVKLNTTQLIDWVNNDQFAISRHYLIKQASLAVDLQDNYSLGQIMQLLARVAATEGDLASTEVYLFEALDIFEQLDYKQGIADTQLLIGQMYAKRRYIAQQAGWAYGELLMARFYLSKGSTYAAKEALDTSIKDNLSLGRTGAVASAYKTMARYYRSINDANGEHNALIEAGKFYAYSGQEHQAAQVLQQLRERNSSLDLIETLEYEINRRLDEYQSQITLVRQARDYMRLYSLYKSKGEAGRAWEFRVKASEILSRTSKRDMYYRAPDVMALLYDSNFNYSRATDYYNRAREFYLSQNDIEAVNQTADFQSTLN